MVNIARKRFNLLVLFSLTICVFIVYRDLFGYYFEADEWFHFTYYFPLTRESNGLLTAILSTFINSGPLSGGQHVIPIASSIFYLNTEFFGLNYAPYAFMSLFFHAINSFLIFLLLKLLLYKKEYKSKNIYALLGAVFFAFAPTPMHTITGAAPFYGQNILSVTYFILCLFFFKKALLLSIYPKYKLIGFIKSSNKYLYLSILFLFFSLFSKETSVFLFVLLPIMYFIEKRSKLAENQVFKTNFLAKLYILSIVIYFIIRFILPSVYNFSNQIYLSTPPQKVLETNTIVSQDISIHPNLPAEILFRSITFPIKMTGSIFVPRQNVISIVKFIAPVVYPMPLGGDHGGRDVGQLGFIVGPGNDAVLYILSLGILLFCLRLFFKLIHQKNIQDAGVFALGFAVIILSALPLVVIVFSFPRWGYDTYFDSRFYYNPSVGAAIVFPFLLIGMSKSISIFFRLKSFKLISFLLFITWFINNIIIFDLTLKQFVQKYGSERRDVVNQLKNYVPILPDKAVFYIETDGKGAFGPVLPFQTSVSQALTLVYYDKNPLSKIFFEKPLFDGNTQGFTSNGNRGFGYYTSKKLLAEELTRGLFNVSNIYSFYYDSVKGKLFDNTSLVRLEMNEYLQQNKTNLDWKMFHDESSGLTFYYPPQVIIERDLNSTIVSYKLINADFTSSVSIYSLSTGFNMDELFTIMSESKLDVANFMKVSYDRLHYNNVLLVNEEDERKYLIRIENKLVILSMQNNNQNSILLNERIIGSISFIEQ